MNPSSWNQLTANAPPAPLWAERCKELSQAWDCFGHECGQDFALFATELVIAQ